MNSARDIDNQSKNANIMKYNAGLVRPSSSRQSRR